MDLVEEKQINSVFLQVNFSLLAYLTFNLPLPLFNKLLFITLLLTTQAIAVSAVSTSVSSAVLWLMYSDGPMTVLYH